MSAAARSRHTPPRTRANRALRRLTRWGQEDVLRFDPGAKRGVEAVDPVGMGRKARYVFDV